MTRGAEQADDFTCIYCHQGSAQVTPSEAHVFPYALGGSASSKATVCRQCNNHVNQDVEIPVLALPVFPPLLSLFGTSGRRGRIRGVRAAVKIGDHEVSTFLNEQGVPPDVIVVRPTDESGKAGYFLYGPEKKLEAKRQELTKRHPGLQWADAPGEISAEVFVPYEVDLREPLLRRLATKVAFERFAMLRSGALVAGREFDEARAFVWTGAEPELCCGVVGNERYLGGAFNIPLSWHAVSLIAHPADDIMGGIVTFFGLFCYWVVLSRRYTALDAWDDCMLENPQRRMTEYPRLHADLRNRMPWGLLIGPYQQDSRQSSERRSPTRNS